MPFTLPQDHACAENCDKRHGVAIPENTIIPVLLLRTGITRGTTSVGPETGTHFSRCRAKMTDAADISVAITGDDPGHAY